MAAGLPDASTKRQAASIFGPMLPGGNSPSARSRHASWTWTDLSGHWLALPYPR